MVKNGKFPLTNLTPSYHKNLTPEKEKVDASIEKLMTGHPPNGYDRWTKPLLIKALAELEGTKKSTTFMAHVVAVGKTKYTHPNGINKMYAAWKRTGIIPAGKGCPNTMKLDEVKSFVKNTLKEYNTKSNAFQLEDMKKVIESKKKRTAEDAGLNPKQSNAPYQTKLPRLQ